MAKAIYDTYCQPNAKVLDPCGGYGGRLLGAMSSGNVSSYTALEPNFSTYQGLLDLREHLRKERKIAKDVSVLNQLAPDGLKQFSDQSFDLCCI